MVKYERLYKVTYNGNSNSSGTKPGDSYHLSGSTVTVASNSGSLAKDGYTFDGWNTSNSGGGTNYTAGSDTFTMSSADKTLYARWKATITLNANSGSAANGSARTYFNSASKLTITTAITPDTGYHITGYYAEPAGTTLVAATDGTLEKNVSGFTDSNGKWNATEGKTLYPQYSNEYTVTFNDHDATIHGTDEATATYRSAMPAITVPRKDGYIFGGYFASAGGGGTQYYNADGSSATNWNVASNTTLHAKWTGIAYHVAFDANGGTGSMSDQDLTYGTSDTLRTNTFTRSGYYFLGWNTNADGSGTAYYDRKSVSTMTTKPGATVTLYAQWAIKRTLYFLNMGVSGWHSGANSGATNRYAYAYIYYDGHKLEPLGAYSSGSSQGTRMTAVSDITLTNVNSGQVTWCWSIANVPEGSTIIFSDNSGNNSYKSGDQSGWTADKPYFCNGNSTWYALDEGETNKISAMSEMSVYIGAGDFASWKFYALDKHGDDTYAIIWLNTNQTYQYKYYNWRTNTYSGAENADAYIINGGGNISSYGPWSLNGSKDVMLKTNTHASGEYKFMLNWSGGTPQTTILVPRGVNLTTTTPTQAKKGESVTVNFTADAWTNLSSGTDKSSLTFYFEFSTDNSNWTTIATVTENNQLQATATYTFAAQSGYFRVKLVNANGVASYSGSTAFTAYTTKSFYVYNPYNDDSNKWRWLHLYTWDSNDGNREYNGSLGDCYIHCTDAAGTHGTGCLNGNDIVAKGNNWFYITIDERANYFLLAGENNNDGYASHKTEDCLVSNYIPDAKYMIVTESSVNKVKEYKAKGASDYRLKYTDASGSRYSNIYNTTLDGTTVTSSLWMNAANGTSLIIQQGSGNDTWADKVTYTNSSNGFGGLVDSDHRDHGYVFKMNINFNIGTPTSSTISNVAVYNGPFYVRTDGLVGGWNVYKKEDHMMHHSANSLSSTPAYDYYLCKWMNDAGTNVKFTVANDYNSELVASLSGDVNSTDPLYGRETLPTPTNVRFSWNSRTNTLTRAYLSAATDASSRFLVMVETTSPQGKIYNSSGTALTEAAGGKISGLNEHELLFADKGNWVYELVIQANPGAQAKVTAKYNNKEAEFIPSTALIGGTGSSKYTYRIVYDFKTNELTNAWVADGSKINDNIELNTNVMLIRSGQDPATQLTFGAGGSISEAKKLIGVMEFEYGNMVGKMSTWNSTAYQNCMYYFSFPFDVKVSDIFGVGEMGTDWRIQKYNGAKRAQIGWFADTNTFWEDVTLDETLNAYEGYSLLLNRINFNNGSSDIWTNISSGGAVYLYFPSKDVAVGSIASQSQPITVPSHVCEIDREFSQDMSLPKAERRNHNYTDSNWNMLGSALFENKTGSTVTPNEVYGTTLNYIYEWNSATNTLAARATLGTSFTFNAMHAYLVQFAGTVVFNGASITPHIAARHTTEKKNYMIELELSKDEVFAGRAYVELRENAVDSFLLNEDMYMLKNSKTADVYTYAGGYDLAANVLTIGNHVVPIGVNVKSAGTYIFSMPSDFSGEVTLVDTYTGTRTNLALNDYEISLEKGTLDDRFLLDINVQKVATAIDGVDGEGTLKDGKAHKFIENGAMYILQNGKVYDARGNAVK